MPYDGYVVWIVEDEEMALRYLAKTVSETPGYGKVLCYESAEDALENFPSARPDLLITDIKLLGMSGLDLIKKIRELDKEMLIIIVSGYALFEFAREALKFNILDYLTKPLDPAKLAALLAQAKNILAERKAKTQFYTDSGDFLEKFPYAFFSLCLVHSIADEESALKKAFSATRSVKGADVYVMPYKQGNIAIIEGAERKENAAHTTLLTNALKRSGFDIVYSDEYFSKDEFKKVTARFSRCMNRSRILGTKIVVELYESGAEFFNDVIVTDINSAMYSRDWNLVFEKFETLSQNWKKRQNSVELMQNQLFAIIGRLHDIFPQRISASPLLERVNESLVHAESYDAFALEMKSLFHEIFAGVKDTGNAAHLDMFERVVQLVKSDLKKNYNLQEICYKFKVSQPYVSKLFRTYAHKTYKEFVLGYKIESALNIMNSSPDMLIKEVAAMLGFEPLYFSTLFTRLTGQTPSQYKESIANTRAAMST